MSKRNRAQRDDLESAQPQPQSVDRDAWNGVEFRHSVLIDLAFVTLPAIVMSALGEHLIAAAWFGVGVLIVAYQSWDRIRGFWRSLHPEPSERQNDDEE